MFRATTLERILLVLSDFAAVSICFYGAFWVQFHSGWIVDKFDPTKTFDQYWSMGVTLGIAWLILFTFAGLYRSWLLLSRTHQILRVLRAVIVGVVLIIVSLFGTEFLGKIFSNQPLSQGYIYGSRFPWIFIYGGMAMVLVAGSSTFACAVSCAWAMGQTTSSCSGRPRLAVRWPRRLRTLRPEASVWWALWMNATR